jgi:hypothetical protein
MSHVILRAVSLVLVMNFIVPGAASAADPCANLTGQARDDCVKQGASTPSKARRPPVDVDAPGEAPGTPPTTTFKPKPPAPCAGLAGQARSDCLNKAGRAKPPNRVDVNEPAKEPGTPPTTRFSKSANPCAKLSGKERTECNKAAAARKQKVPLDIEAPEHAPGTPPVPGAKP